VAEAVELAAVDDELVVVAHSLAGFTGPLVGDPGELADLLEMYRR